jgi:ribosomal protein L11 methyltransferase
MNTINWDDIWKIHAPHYKDGCCHIPLDQDKTIFLEPGPGFGDLSHPTTELIINFLKPLAKNKIVVDIGSGSGILSIAAALLGAKAVYPFEIDQDAISHAKRNFKINNLKIPINQIPPQFDLVCMNMISSEQKIALEQYPFIRKHPHLLLSSGILIEEKETYLKNMNSYSFEKENSSQGWLALALRNNFN